MSTYKLETPRPRPPPLPIRSTNFNPKSASSPRLSGTHNSPSTLLYDLPPTFTPSPTRAKSSPGFVSPTSPTFRSRSRGPGRVTSPTPTVGNRNSIAAANNVRSEDLEQFAEHCRAWYYDQNDHSGRIMTQTFSYPTPISACTILPTAGIYTLCIPR
ncbi:hypothetical protein QCA50_004194 [Cerrena zonata]|uniref:Uncharacterized protein n=1 Tax=Cerrena zonata TaxID=2478898 RepID=A0AAW0GL81_9APHY